MNQKTAKAFRQFAKLKKAPADQDRYYQNMKAVWKTKTRQEKARSNRYIFREIKKAS